MCDLILAKKTKNIDLIIGGHTHTFMNKPIETRNSIGKKVLINQVGCYGINLGKIDFYFSKNSILEKSNIINV
jgi:5'-nucleotidase